MKWILTAIMVLALGSIAFSAEPIATVSFSPGGGELVTLTAGTETVYLYVNKHTSFTFDGDKVTSLSDLVSKLAKTETVYFVGEGPTAYGAFKKGAFTTKKPKAVATTLAVGPIAAPQCSGPGCQQQAPSSSQRWELFGGAFRLRK
jgi:hypothetical protein